jgi:hypothetical protein
MLDIVRKICAQVGPGLPGSCQERGRIAIVKKELVSHLSAGNVVFEEFTVAPGAFLGTYPNGAFLILIAVLLNISLGRFKGISPWLTVIAALAFSIISSLQFILEFILYFELLDPFFRRRHSLNVFDGAPAARFTRRLVEMIESGYGLDEEQAISATVTEPKTAPTVGAPV